MGSPEVLAHELDNEGIAPGLLLSAGAIADISAFAHANPCFLNSDSARPAMVRNRGAFAPDRASGILVGDYLDSIDGCAAIRALRGDPVLIAVARRYLGCEPVLKRSRLWWTFCGTDPSRDVLSTFSLDHFHFDLDDWLCLKFFFYLTDVGVEDGPHAMIRGSHRYRPLALQFSPYKGRDMRTLCQAYSQDDFVAITGPAGFGCAEDPFVFHTGMKPASRHRLMLEIEFGVTALSAAGPYGAPGVISASPAVG